jgi:rhodanese-related sulfurtransferase
MTGSLDGRGLPAGYPFKDAWEITPRDARKLAETGAALIVDVRTNEEIAVAAVAGALPIPLHELEQRADEIPESASVLTLCHHGVRSMKAAAFLRAVGFPDARSIAGGIELWSLAADPSVPRYERHGGVCTVLPRA